VAYSWTAPPGGWVSHSYIARPTGCSGWPQMRFHPARIVLLWAHSRMTTFAGCSRSWRPEPARPRPPWMRSDRPDGDRRAGWFRFPPLRRRRRGVGKSMLLLSVAKEARERGRPVAYVDVETLRDNPFPDVLIRLLIDITQALDNNLGSLRGGGWKGGVRVDVRRGTSRCSTRDWEHCCATPRKLSTSSMNQLVGKATDEREAVCASPRRLLRLRVPLRRPGNWFPLKRSRQDERRRSSRRSLRRRSM
jgi:hypothetical protein